MPFDDLNNHTGWYLSTSTTLGPSNEKAVLWRMLLSLYAFASVPLLPGTISLAAIMLLLLILTLYIGIGE